MVVLLAIVVLGGWWGLADGITSDDDEAPRQPNFISAPPPRAYGPPDTVEYKPGLNLDVYRPKGPGPFPAVLLIHGGGFTVGSRGDLAFTGVELADRGVLAASIDYTLTGSIDPARADVADAYEWLTQRPDVDPARVALLGTSAGCALSAWHALSTHEPRAAVLVACPMFFPDLVSSSEPEILLVTNTGDTNLHPYSKTLDQLLTERSARHDVVVHRGGDHFSTLGDNWPAVAAWLLPRLKP